MCTLQSAAFNINFPCITAEPFCCRTLVSSLTTSKFLKTGFCKGTFQLRSRLIHNFIFASLSALINAATLIDADEKISQVVMYLLMFSSLRGSFKKIEKK